MWYIMRKNVCRPNVARTSKERANHALCVIRLRTNCDESNMNAGALLVSARYIMYKFNNSVNAGYNRYWCFNHGALARRGRYVRFRQHDETGRYPVAGR
jgi:hypothetical protein